MDTLNKNIDNFLGNAPIDGEQVCDVKTGVCYIKSKDGLIERTIIDKKLVLEDGRELLREENAISHSQKSYLR